MFNKKFKHLFTFGNNKVYISLMLPKVTRGSILTCIRQGMITEDLELGFDVSVDSCTKVTSSWIDWKGVKHEEYTHKTFIVPDVTFGVMF